MTQLQWNRRCGYYFLEANNRSQDKEHKVNKKLWIKELFCLPTHLWKRKELLESEQPEESELFAISKSSLKPDLINLYFNNQHNPCI